MRCRSVFQHTSYLEAKLETKSSEHLQVKGKEKLSLLNTGRLPDEQTNAFLLLHRTDQAAASETGWLARIRRRVRSSFDIQYRKTVVVM